MFDFEDILIRAKRSSMAHFESAVFGHEECCCGEAWPCQSKHLLDETVPAMVYALEGAERVHADPGQV